MSQLLTVHQAAEYVGLKPATLNQYRWAGGGPPFFRIGNRTIRYDQADLEVWLRRNRFTSTSEAKVHGT